MERRTIVRVVPFLTAMVAALLIVPVFGVWGAVFGLFGGFFLGAFGIAAYYVFESWGASRREAQMHSEAMVQLKALGSLGPMRIAAPPARRSAPVLQRELERIDVRAATDLDDALSAAEQLKSDYPRSALLLSTLGTLYLAADRIDEAVAAAREAINQALRNGATPVAARVYEAFHDHREALLLDAAILLSLGRAYGHQKRWADAVECIERAGAAGLDSHRVQKEIIGTCDRAAREGHHEDALALFSAFVQRHPDSTFADFARRQVERLRRLRDRSRSGLVVSPRSLEPSGRASSSWPRRRCGRRRRAPGRAGRTAPHAPALR